MRLCLAAAPLLVVSLLLDCSPAPACSLCGGYARRSAFVAEYWQAQAAVCGTLANPKLDGASGSGTTELHVEKVLKPDPRLKGVNPIVLPRYLTVLNAKNPPRFLILLDDKLFPFSGREVTPAFLTFLTESETVRGKPRPQTLAHFAKFLGDPDPAVADEAFLEFARASDKECFEAVRSLKPEVFRRLVRDAKVDAERLSLFAFLLGATGDATDADLLLNLLQHPDKRTAQALEGILAGYILRRPKEGWAWAYTTLSNPKQTYLTRWGTVRAMRFLYGAHPAEYRTQVLHATGLMIPSGELADMAMADLQKWQLWDHTRLILAQYGKASHSAPIVRSGLLRYAVACPLPEARQFIAKLRVREPQLVRELEEDLALEKDR